MTAPSVSVNVHVDADTVVSASANRNAENRLYGTVNFGGDFPQVTVFVRDVATAERIAREFTELADRLVLASTDVPA